MGRTSDARDRLLDTAARLIHSRGYNAVGINELCAEAGIKKGSFYHFFDSKVALVEAVIAMHLERMKGLAADRPEPTPLERLMAFAGAVCGTYLAPNPEDPRLLGCPIGNLAAEMSTQEEPIRRAVAACYGQVSQIVMGFLDEAVAAGQLPPCNTADKAFELLTFMQGAAIVSKALGDPAAISRAMQNLPAMLMAPSPPAAPPAAPPPA